MEERYLTSTWRSPYFRMGSHHASSALCVESKTRKRSMSGITLKVFTSRVTSAIRVSIARKHSRAKMLCAFTFLKCTNIRNCDAIISHSNSMYLVIIRSNIIKSVWFSQCSVLLLYWGHHFHVRLKRFTSTFIGGWIPPYKGLVRKRPQAKQ